MFLAKPAQMLAEARALALVAADADVDVVALRKDPAVATGDDRKLEHHRPGVARLVREVRFERDAVHDLAAEPELAGGDAVAAVGADDDACRDLGPVNRQPVRAHVRDLDPVAHVGTGLCSLLQEEVVEPDKLDRSDLEEKLRGCEQEAERADEASEERERHERDARRYRVFIDVASST